MRGRFAYVAAGAAAMYLLDPDQGRGRRARLRDRAVAARRRTLRRVDRLERQAANVAAGQDARRRGLGHHRPHGTAEMREYLRGVIHGIAGHAVNVDVDDLGVVTVRGQIEDESVRRALLDAITREAGVAEVVDLTHLPGEPAPNKVAALRASARATAGVPTGRSFG
ncbi:MAG TPA: BON domain-containing protein [Acidimicrobiales bacterium]